MSVASLGRLAAARDDTVAGRPVPALAPPGKDETGLDAAAPFRSVLVHAVPTEVLAAYTAVVGVVSGAVTADDPRHYLGLRWALLAAFAVVTPVSVLVAARLQARSHGRLPLLEATAATVAALAWFLAMPGSPLSVGLHGSDGAVASALITVCAGSLLAALAPWLSLGSRTATVPSARSGGSTIPAARHRVPPPASAPDALDLARPPRGQRLAGDRT